MECLSAWSLIFPQCQLVITAKQSVSWKLSFCTWPFALVINCQVKHPLHWSCRAKAGGEWYRRIAQSHLFICSKIFLSIIHSTVLKQLQNKVSKKCDRVLNGRQVTPPSSHLLKFNFLPMCKEGGSQCGLSHLSSGRLGAKQIPELGLLPFPLLNGELAVSLRPAQS